MASASGADALFKSSITSRRFPALRALTSDDVEVMALPPRPSPEKRAQKAAAAGEKSRLFDPDLVNDCELEPDPGVTRKRVPLVRNGE